MTVYLDDHPLALDQFSPDAPVREVVDAARRSLHDTGRMLVGLRCDREDVAVDAIESVLAESVGRFDRLDLLSARPRDVVLETLTAGRATLGETFGTLKDAAASLAAGDTAEAMKALHECAAAWSQVQESIVKGARLLDIDVEKLEIDGRPLIDSLGELVKRLRDVRDAIESRDHVLLGDILRYEMDETLQTWERMVDGLIEHVRSIEP